MSRPRHIEFYNGQRKHEINIEYISDGYDNFITKWQMLCNGSNIYVGYYEGGCNIIPSCINFTFGSQLVKDEVYKFRGDEGLSPQTSIMMSCKCGYCKFGHTVMHQEDSLGIYEPYNVPAMLRIAIEHIKRHNEIKVAEKIVEMCHASGYNDLTIDCTGYLRCNVKNCKFHTCTKIYKPSKYSQGILHIKCAIKIKHAEAHHNFHMAIDSLKILQIGGIVTDLAIERILSFLK